MGKLHLDGYAGKVKYAQLLHDASEVRFRGIRRLQAVVEQPSRQTLTLDLPIVKPDVAIPVVELFLE